MDDRVTKNLDLLREAESGKLDDLSCPQCQNAAVSVSFSNTSSYSGYVVWFRCSACNFWTSAQGAVKPKYWSDQRMLG
jgi:hypothetical protein